MDQKKISPVEFVLRFLNTPALRHPQYPKGIHVVYSGFNQAFREYFDGDNLDPKQVIQEMAEQAQIKFRIARGGARIYLPHEIEGDPIVSVEQTLKKMGMNLDKKKGG
jgi:hypothetical protein